MTDNYPVPGRDPVFGRRLAGHEAGHALVGRCLGTTIWNVSIIPDGHFEGRCLRSGPTSPELGFNPSGQTMEIVDICAFLETLTPELGTDRVASADYYVRCQNNVIELVAGECAESLLHPELKSLGAKHDFAEAAVIASIAVAAPGAVDALIAYAKAEATALLAINRDVLAALTAALVERGILTGEEVDEVIANTVYRRTGAAEAEKARRIDWRERERNATTFESSALC